MPAPYMVSSLPPHEVAELHRLMNEEIKEVAVFFMNPDGVITTWNRAAEEMKGYTGEDAIGQHLALLYTDEDKARGWPEHNLQEARNHGFYREETWRKRKDGRLFWAQINLTALRDDTGTLVGFSKITLDLTEHKLLEQCTKEREQIRRVLHAARAGTWTWHPDKAQIVVSADFLDLLGYTVTETTMTSEQWLAFLHPDDHARMAEAFDYAHTIHPGAPLITETRMRQKDGSYRWFSVRADWYREQEDSPYVLSGVSVDIHNEKTAEESLQLAVDKLTEADARKDEFLAMLAHELRNPLAPVRAAADLLNMITRDEVKVRHTSNIIARQVDHMTGLVDDLLDVSRVTRGLVELEKTPLDMRHVVNEAVEQVNPLLHARRHHLALHLARDVAMVLGDKKRLVQILANLLQNAGKYTHEGGHIVLRTEVRDSKVLISVTDDGIGMEPELAARVFDLFTQAKRTPDRSSGGLGLGLALVKSLTELHGGTVSCSSEGPGKGSVFAVSLPLLPAHSKPAESTHAGSSLKESNKSLRVMVVDDNADAAHMLAMLLEASGHQVMVEYRARQALERARTEMPDVCLLDIGLPEIDGNELAKRLKAEPETARAVLIAVTGYGQWHDRNSALAAGFSHYFVKPVDTAKLIAVLEDIDPLPAT
ncbi:MAG: putative histidine kinase, hybrid [Noviherbaspirillum sp.]|nr:putative histidine kinase, hybrid [Noviherbaspirillum sp.]